MKQVPSKGDKKKTTAKSVDDYLESVPEKARATLEKIRQLIRSAAPDAEEGFSYGIPAFRYKGRPIAGYAALKDHCSFFPMSSSVVSAHAAELKGYELSKGTIRFPINKPLPAALVKKLVKARIAEIEEGGGKYSSK
jgi:uncharacterized protein YdhG (YjbR/CyaY superfamily)